MAPSRDRNVRLGESDQGKSKKSSKTEINSKVDLVLESRKHANAVFDILEYLQAEKEDEVVCAVNACNRMFCALLERGDLFIGQLPKEEETVVTANYSAEEKYKMWMRHRYNSCVEQLQDLMIHEAYRVRECALCTLMKLVEKEGKTPLIAVDWDEHYNFPREHLKSVVERLLSEEEDMSLLISRFQEFLDFEDVRYYVMGFVTENVAKVMQKAKEAVPLYQNNVFTLMTNITMPSQQTDLVNFLVKQEAKHEDWKAAKLKDHRRVFERMWLGFLKYKLPSGMYKKVLVILHDSILPHMSKPALMIDFLTAAYDVGGAISLLALNGLFVLIHEHNLDYPDFYKKLYSLLEPSIFHVKYRARFFNLADLFLSSSHLPVYLVAAFVKRLSRLALTAPPAALLMIIPFVCNLIRRHPSCRVLIHRPSAAEAPCEDPYVMEETDPVLCHAMESSLWELQTLQKHYHPDVAKAAAVISKPLSELEDDLNEVLELSAYEIFERDLKAKAGPVPLEFEPAKELLNRPGEVVGQHFTLE